MVFRTLFKQRPAMAAGARLYEAAVAQARDPGFYARLGVADTPEGRFESYTLHVALLTRRLNGCGEQAAETAQGLMDAYIGALDIALREMGTGDLSMAKKMKKLGQAFYGRLQALSDAFDALPNEDALSEVLARTVLEGGGGELEALTAYVIDADKTLSAFPLDRLMAGEAVWPKVP